MLRRAAPLGAAALAALVAGVVVGAGPDHARRGTAKRYVQLWARGDYGAMYDLLDNASRLRVTRAAFAAAYDAAARTATVTALAVDRVTALHGGDVTVRVTVRTRAFGTLSLPLVVPVTGDGSHIRVAWRARLVFPGLRNGETLTRHTQLAPRSALLARDGSVLAEGSSRTSKQPDVAAQIVGHLGPAPAQEWPALQAAGYPDDAQVGVTGLERLFEDRLAGTPGGELLAGTRTLARTAPRPGAPVRATIDPQLERAAAAALGGRYGGAAAIDPATGEVLALAGVAYSALQPPGSTFKIITATAALEAKAATLGTVYPIETETHIEGVPLQNANGEWCGGTLQQSFAQSCNSVFAPLGVKVGAARLVATAERFGFNHRPAIATAAQSSIPPANAIGDALAVGSSAIGQGAVQATTLEMTTVAATIATGGVRVEPTLLLGQRARRTRVTTPRIAHEVAAMMRAVVTSGTGTGAAIAGANVAGKTGTAELRNTVPPPGQDDTSDQSSSKTSDKTDTDAWFVAFAPGTGRARIAVGVLFPEAGAGGEVAAPAARGLIAAGLAR